MLSGGAAITRAVTLAAQLFELVAVAVGDIKLIGVHLRNARALPGERRRVWNIAVCRRRRLFGGFFPVFLITGVAHSFSILVLWYEQIRPSSRLGFALQNLSG